MLIVDDKNTIFSSENVFFFVGIGGISMSALALIMLEKGFEVRGYDRDSDTPLVNQLKKAGIPICHSYYDGVFDGVTRVVYTAAIQDSDIMLSAPRTMGLFTMERSEFLGQLMKTEGNPIGIAGTHGKSSTTGMISSIFLEARRDPTVLVGAEMPSLGGCYHIGKGKDFIFEACEYKDSFLDFFPGVAVVLNIALDHVDYFGTIENIIASFRKYIFIAHTAILNYDCENCHKAAEGYENTLIWFSESGNENADYYAGNMRLDNGCAVFDAYFKGQYLGVLHLGVVGAFHIGNALAALATAHSQGIDFVFIQKGLASFTGVKRRFERKGYYHGALVVEDYAHHPDEIRATVSAALSIHKNHVIAIFQPHTYTRTAKLFNAFTKAFQGCHKVLFADIYSAREKPNGVTSQMLAQQTENGLYCPDDESIVNALDELVQKGDILLVLGAGNINRIIPKIMKVSQ
ncbi:MAG TPA: UDP-N-acetylmuramate--L-alanine ligase [Clostridiales bacterium]|jgi:UDP-N-acetylmuramate--alanine ligase|nr:UDP-N-acetylmuramate--L-alanine ligase [Clostridiales bacterium]